MSRVLLIVAVLLAGACSPEVGAAVGPGSARARVEAATVQVLDGRNSHAGVLVSQGRYVVGAQHCVPRAHPDQLFRVRFRDGHIVPARLVRADERLDLAVYSVPRMHGQHALPWPPDGALLPTGATVIAAGHPRRVPWTVAAGEALGEQQLGGIEIPLLVIRLATFPGASGGPVACEQGHLVGLVVRGREDDAVGLAVPVRFIRSFVEGATDSAPTATPVTVYSTQSCSSCRELKRHLRDRGVLFEERDASDQRVWQQLVAIGATRGVRVDGVPVTLIGDRLVQGFNRGELDRALREVGL